ncbi:MAG: tandem-95 repeat protein, partial [Erysipelotrichaceae bacterium]|nr:tandem-95 repeat protein [Erysipelotrichaceae bacterium]
PNFTGNDSFTYKVNDGTVDSNIATVTINVGSVNDAPVAVEDSYSINEDTLLTVVVPGILGNDTDDDGDALTVALITNVAHGTLALNADGSFTYLPAANYFGPDSFTYQVNDGMADSNIVTVSITVNPINDAPVANNDYYETDEDTPITIPAPGFYANDVDPDNAIYHNMYVSGNQFGSLNAPFDGNGTFTYTPALNFTGVAAFWYQITDGQYTSEAYIYITVNPVNDAPVAQDDSYIIDEDNPLSVPAAGVMENDSDVDGPSLNVSLLSDVSNGTLVLNPDGSFEYTPDANFNGVDSFTYTLTDGTLSDTATVTITINAINDAPVAEDDAYSTDEDVQLVIAAPGILGNDVDVDSIFSIDDHGQPANGTVVVQPDGSFVYTPNANFNGVDSFVYGITDGEHIDTATVTITVNPINDVPTADNKTLTVAEGGAGSGLFTGLDADGDVLTFKILTQPVNGTVSFNATTGSFTYTHNGGETTSDSFTYAVNDGKVDSAAATVSITVTPVNDAPTAAGATYTVQIGSVFSRNFIRGDADGDPLTISIVNGPDRGSVSIAGGQFTYTHDGVTLDSDTFTFRVYDGQAYSPIRTIRVNFTALPFVNTAPEVDNATFETEFETALNETVGDLGSDFDNDPLTFTLVTQPAHGTVTLNADGTFRYVPDNDYEGDDSFTYKANDGTDDSNIATVTITVGEEVIVDPEPTPEATLPWWWLLGLLPFLLFLIRRPRPEVQDVALNPDGTITTTWGYLGPRLMHKDYDRDESILEVVSGDVKVLPPVEKVPYEFDRGRHENIFKTVSDKNAVIRWTIKKKAEELDKELIEKMLKKNQK